MRIGLRIFCGYLDGCKIESQSDNSYTEAKYVRNKREQQ